MPFVGGKFHASLQSETLRLKRPEFGDLLDGSTHLYMRVYPSVRPSVGPLDGWMDGNLFFLNDDDHNSRNNDRYNDYTDF